MPIADLLTNLHVVLPKLLEEEKAQQTKVWEKFLYLRATFIEKKIGESLGAIFDKKKILQNLFYEFQGQRYETDTLIPYDNKIILIEAKSGFFSEPAKRGGIMSLKKDLQNLIHSALEQSSRTMRYIKSTENAVFTDESGREIYKIEMACEKVEFYLINVTLEPLRFFSIDLHQLKSLNLFCDGEYPWSANLLDFDIVTRCLELSPIFLHYVASRLRAQAENIFYSPSELSFLSWYLQKGNFISPLTPDGSRPAIVSLTGEWIDPFDSHFLYDKPLPKIRMDEDLLQIIRYLNDSKPAHFSEIVNTLLELMVQEKELIMQTLRDLSKKSNKKGRMCESHYLPSSYNEIGFTIMTQYGNTNLCNRLQESCQGKMRPLNLPKWIGIAKDVSDKHSPVDCVILLTR